MFLLSLLKNTQELTDLFKLLRPNVDTSLQKTKAKQGWFRKGFIIIQVLCDSTLVLTVPNKNK